MSWNLCVVGLLTLMFNMLHQFSLIYIHWCWKHDASQGAITVYVEPSVSVIRESLFHFGCSGRSLLICSLLFILVYFYLFEIWCQCTQSLGIIPRSFPLYNKRRGIPSPKK